MALRVSTYTSAQSIHLISLQGSHRNTVEPLENLSIGGMLATVRINTVHLSQIGDGTCGMAIPRIWKAGMIR
jgi:hypothetical protein